ncbi:MAG TPA: lipase maturation factor family protein [Gammaproteobacteria bacterium]|nr:lipase maturation factor family protein [Gammaproteobacteria bacterium]
MPDNNKKPRLIYDGDCGICRYWVNYWRCLTRDTVDYVPYQQVHEEYPDISQDEFRRSIQLIIDDTNRYSGAEAVYTLLNRHFPYNLLYRCYQFVPGFSWCAEQGYNFFAGHRGLLKWISYCLWGKQLQPARYDVISGLYLRLLGVIYLSAFTSLGTQITGLAGSNGILPVTDFLHQAQDQLGATALLKIPTIFWLVPGDFWLQAACWLGAILSCLVIFNVFTRTALAINFVLYLSLYYASQVFLQFQWDLLLLECGFLALFLAHGTWIITALYRWLVFRFMLLSGLVKLFSGDPTWDNLTALAYHFETQPLPTPLAWYAHHLPGSVITGLTAATLIIELVLPWLVFAPRNIRMVTGCVFILFQTGILLTGNYNFFNLLTIFTCLFLFDDAAIRKLLPAAIHKQLGMASTVTLPIAASAIVSGLVISLSLAQLTQIMSGHRLPVLSSMNQALSPLHIVNEYGPFAVMTRTRHEIIIQGSYDGRNWQAYRFRYNPGDVQQRPEWIIPHQPRLDWQMWFAALSRPERVPWFAHFLKRLLQGSSQVTGLLQYDPFAGKPPTYVRAVVYEYHFTDRQALTEQQQWWRRSYRGIYFPAVKLEGERLRVVR